MPNLDGTPESLDLLCGIRSIAMFLGVSERRARYWIQLDALPVSHLGRSLIASKSDLKRCFSELLKGQNSND
jgi:hypothetical protein